MKHVFSLNEMKTSRSLENETAKFSINKEMIPIFYIAKIKLDLEEQKVRMRVDIRSRG